MARDLRDLPRAQLAVDLARERLTLLLQPPDLFGDVDGGIVLHVAQLVDFRFELRDRLFEFEEGHFHGGSNLTNNRRRRSRRWHAGIRLCNIRAGPNAMLCSTAGSIYL
jgi:hypothetical protein